MMWLTKGVGYLNSSITRRLIYTHDVQSHINTFLCARNIKCCCCIHGKPQ